MSTDREIFTAKEGEVFVEGMNGVSRLNGLTSSSCMPVHSNEGGEAFKVKQ